MAFDTLIHNGTILTCSPAFDVIPRGWIGIAGGRIQALGPGPGHAGLPAAGQMIDARGGIVMPGLVNTHTHLPMTLLRGLADDLPLEVWLNEHIFPAERAVITPESVRWGTLLACAEMALAGTTTCVDGYFHEDAVAEAVIDFGLRAVLGQGVIDFPAPGVSGADQSLTAAGEFARRWLNRTDTIAPSVFCHSPYTCSADTLCRAKRLCDDMGLLFQIHVAETQAESDHIRSIHGVSPVAYLERLGLLDDRTLLVHCVRADDGDIALIARRNAKVSHNPESNMKLAAGVAPVPQMLAAGITVGLGTDGCASNNDLDLFQAMDLTAKLHKVVHRDPTVIAGRGRDPHGDHRRRPCPGAGTRDRLPCARQAGRPHHHRHPQAAPDADLPPGLRRRLRRHRRGCGHPHGGGQAPGATPAASDRGPEPDPVARRSDRRRQDGPRAAERDGSPCNPMS